MIKLAFLLEIPVKQEWYDRILDKLRRHSIDSADLNGLQVLASCQKDACGTPRETVEAIYDIVLRHDSLQNAGIREAHAFTSYGFYLINKHGEFRQGLDYLYRAVDAMPDHAQNWINLIKVLVAMHRPDEAEQQLERFQAAGVSGASDRDFKHLADLIGEARNVPAEQATSQTVAEKLE